MSAQGDVERPFVNLCRDRRRGQVVRSAHHIFRGIVIKAAPRDDLADAERTIPHDGDGQLAAGDKAFD